MRKTNIPLDTPTEKKDIPKSQVHRILTSNQAKHVLRNAHDTPSFQDLLRPVKPSRQVLFALHNEQFQVA